MGDRLLSRIEVLRADHWPVEIFDLISKIRRLDLQHEGGFLALNYLEVRLAMLLQKTGSLPVHATQWLAGYALGEFADEAMQLHPAVHEALERSWAAQRRVACALGVDYATPEVSSAPEVIAAEAEFSRIKDSFTRALFEAFGHGDLAALRFDRPDEWEEITRRARSFFHLDKPPTKAYRVAAEVRA
jgi:hypothetical protein